MQKPLLGIIMPNGVRDTQDISTRIFIRFISLQIICGWHAWTMSSECYGHTYSLTDVHREWNWCSIKTCQSTRWLLLNVKDTWPQLLASSLDHHTGGESAQAPPSGTAINKNKNMASSHVHEAHCDQASSPWWDGCIIHAPC